MGVVYKARDVKLNRVVALKMILGGPRPNPRHLARLATEAGAIAALRHPHVVQVYDFGYNDGLPYLTMELVDGGTLQDRIARDGPFAQRDAAELVAKQARSRDPVPVRRTRSGVRRDLETICLKCLKKDPTRCRLAASGSPTSTPH